MVGCCASTLSATASLFPCQVKCMCITLSRCYSASVPVECDMLSDAAQRHYGLHDRKLRRTGTVFRRLHVDKVMCVTWLATDVS